MFAFEAICIIEFDEECKSSKQKRFYVCHIMVTSISTSLVATKYEFRIS